MAETFERPFIGDFIRLLGAFPLPHGTGLQKIIPAIDWALRRGRCVHFFPEGELDHYNQRPNRFHEGVFYLAERFNVPIVPLTLVIRDRRILGLKIAKPLIQVTVEIGEPLLPALRPSHGRKEAARTMAKVARTQMTESIRTGSAR
jgi:1-acyl-sn-glycerol-3-phosphate acyltransferase